MVESRNSGLKSGSMRTVHLHGSESTKWLANAGKCRTLHETGQYKRLPQPLQFVVRLRLKCDGTRAETRFRLSAKRTIHLNRRGVSVQSTTGSRGVRISGSNAGYTMFRGSVKSTGYPLHSPVSHSLPRRASLCAITFQLQPTKQLRSRS